MDWNRIKTIFIVTFLILDIYLLYQFMIKRDANQYEFMTEASLEEQLKADEISYIDLPKIAIKEQYLSARLKEFSEEDLKGLKGQEMKITQKTLLASTLDEPYPLDLEFKTGSLSGFIAENVPFGSEYQFWEKDEKKKTLIYLQQFQNKFFYQKMNDQNRNGMLVFHLNEDNQIISYEQTYLDEIEKLDVKQEVLSPLKAIEVVHQKGLLKPKSKITKVELGYSTIVPLTSSQVFAPTWRLVVNNDKSLYVNAFEGQVIDFESDETKVTE